MPSRTKNEAAADAFDLDLHRLILHAERLSSKTPMKHNKRNWIVVAQKLAVVRSEVRGMMNKIDVERTS